jgi:hypothetical protein
VSYLQALDLNLAKPFNNIFYLEGVRIKLLQLQGNSYTLLANERQAIFKLCKSYLRALMINNIPLDAVIFTEYFGIYFYNMTNHEATYNSQIMNKLSYIDPNECLTAIQKLYRLKSDVPIPAYKVDWYSAFIYNPEDIGRQKLNEVTLQVFQPNSLLMEFDESFFTKNCQSETEYFDIYSYSAAITDEITKKYMTYKELDIDITDPSHRFFNSKCFIFKNSTNQMDIPLVTRKRDIYLAISYNCGDGCTYKGNSEDNYVICTCRPRYFSKVYVEKKGFDDYSTNNMDIVTCAISLESNTGFIVVIVILAIGITAIVISIVLFKRTLVKNFKHVLYSDCNTLITKTTLVRRGRNLIIILVSRLDMGEENPENEENPHVEPISEQSERRHMF